MAGEGHEGIGVLARLRALHIVAPVFGRHHARLLDGVVIGEGPAVVAAFLEDEHVLGRLLGVVLVRVVRGIHRAQVVAPHLHDEEVLGRGIPGDGQHVAVAGRVVEAVGLGLVELARVEAPPPAVRLQELRRVLALGAQSAVLLSAVGIGGRADLDVELAVRPEREGLRVVLSLVGQARHHELRRPFRHQLARRHLVTVDGAGGRGIEIAVAQRDPAPAALAERFLHVGAAVAVRVAQGNDAAETRLHVDVSVRGHGQEADGTGGIPVLQRVCDHDGAEAFGQRDAAVVGIRGQLGRGGRPGGRRRLAVHGGDEAAGTQNSEHQDR